MSRFRPDGWNELLGRTFEMADFQGGVYVEIIAPDLRPAALSITAVIGLLWWLTLRPRVRHTSAAVQAKYGSYRVLVAALLGWLVAWGAWLAVSGNGRYALTLLVLTGPLLGATLWLMPIRNDWRWLLLCIVIGAQLILLNSSSPSKAWAMLRHRWTTAEPLAHRETLLAPLNPDLIIATQSQTMTALLVNTPAARRARWLSLDFADAMGLHSIEGQRAIRAIAEAKNPVLLDSYNTDFIDPKDIHMLLWRQRSQDMLSRYGLVVDAATCRRKISPLNVMQVACGLDRIAPVEVVHALAAPLAEESMNRLIALCGVSLWPYGARSVEPDGSLVQVFRETRYVVRAAPDGGLYVRWHRDVSFRPRWKGFHDSRLWNNVDCSDIIRNSHFN